MLNNYLKSFTQFWKSPSSFYQSGSSFRNILRSTLPTFYYALIGILVGLVIAAFFLALDFVQTLFLEYLGCFHKPSPKHEEHFFHFQPLLGNEAFSDPHLLFLLALIPAAGGLLCGLLKFKLASVDNPEQSESDVFIDGFHNKNGIIPGKDGLVRGICSVLTIGSGGSGGREGPSAMLGATIGSICSKFLKIGERERKKIVSATGGAGIAAIFKAPLGGAFFGIETLYRRDMEIEALIPAIICSIAAYLVMGFFFGIGPLYEIGTYNLAALLKPFSLLLFLILGIATIPFIFLFIKLERISHSFFFEKLTIPAYLKPCIGGFLLGMLFLFGCFLIGVIKPQSDGGIGIASGLFGGGYGFLQLAFCNKLALSVLAFVAVAKTAGTALTLDSGGSGGSFVPSLTNGAAIGGAIGQVFSYLFPATVVNPWVFSLVGAATFFGVAANAPLTALFVVSEISGSYELFVPALLAIVPAYALIWRWSIYPTQYEIRKDSPAHRKEFFVDVLQAHTVNELLSDLKQVYLVPENMNFSDFKQLFSNINQHYFPVKNEQGEFIGIFSSNDFRDILFEEDMEDLVLVKDIAHTDIISTTPSEDLNSVMHKFTQKNIDALPVLKEDDQTCLLGMLRRREVIDFYNKELNSIKYQENPEGQQ